MNTRNKHFIAISFMAAMAVSSATALPAIFNSRLSAADRSKLESGQVVIRNISNANELCITSQNAGAQKVISTVKALKPAYVAEVIRVYPYEGNENFIQKFSSMVMDIPSYAGIPYYSEQAEAWYDLYSSATIRSSSTTGNTQRVIADLVMEPFGLINTQIDTETASDYFFYVQTNLNKMRYYDKFDCVKPNKMKSVIAVFREGDNWILYGVGAVDAPSIFFLRDRVETSFRNRIRAFCQHFFAKM